VNSLLRFAKFSKVYKIVRLTRLAKVFKVLKKNKTLLSKMTEKLRINNGFERLAIFVSFFALFIHVAACMFVLLANFEEDYATTWVEIWEPESDGHCYVMSIYFVVVTVSTVGYGDIIPGTTWERVFCILLMFVGVSAFTFVSGALSSIISNYD
jgi:voltage-gated potassium channel Kch